MEAEASEPPKGRFEPYSGSERPEIPRDSAKAPRISSRDLGCGDVYGVSYSGSLLIGVEDKALLNGYIDAFQFSTRKIREWMVELHSANLNGQILASLLLVPSKVHPDVRNSPAWADAGGGWQALAAPNLYRMLREMVFPGGQSTAAGKRIAELLNRHSLSSPLLNPETFNQAFGRLGNEGSRATAATASAGSLRSLLSAKENVRAEMAERNATRERLLGQFPTFFGEFYRVMDDAGRWREACRHLKEVRRRLHDELEIDFGVIAACQRVLVFSRPELAVWWTSRGVTDAERAIAQENSAVTMAIAAALPSNPMSAPITGDVFRRLSPNGNIFAVSKDAFCARTIITLYDDQFHVFAADERTRLADQIAQLGRNSIHVGWQELLRISDKRSREFRDFVAGPVREFVRACRAIRDPNLKADARIWPLWDEGIRRGWHCVEARPGGVGNALRLRIRIPPFDHNPVSRNIAVTLRGYIPLAKARRLAEPIKIKAGLTKFHPDAAMVVPGTGSRETFAKAQALRIMSDGARFRASIYTAQITQEVTPRVSDELIPIGRKLGLLHFLPGGARIATLSAFERTPSGWRLIKLKEEVTRTDALAFRNGVRIHNTSMSGRQFLHVESDSIDRLLGFILDGESENNPVLNEIRMARIGAARTAVTTKFMREVAARVARVLLLNSVGDLLVAGGGRLISRRGFSLPSGKLFALRRVGSRKVPIGFLVTALQKSGVRLHFTHARFSQVMSKGYLADRNISQLDCGIPFHFARKGEHTIAGRSSNPRLIQGGVRRRLFDGATNTNHDYALNAAWSILLGWCDPQFAKLARNAMDQLAAALTSPRLPLR